MRMFSGGIPETCWRTLLQSTPGNPRKSVLQIAMRVLSFSKTSARTVNSPIFWLTGLDGPTPPETGSRGAGVTLRKTMAARNAAGAGQVWTITENRRQRTEDKGQRTESDL